VPAGAGERQLAEFVEDEEIEPRQVLGELAGVVLTGFELEPVDAPVLAARTVA
jgi:hypothetical protein